MEENIQAVVILFFLIVFYEYFIVLTLFSSAKFPLKKEI